MSHFRAILNQHGLTEQQWRVLRALLDDRRWSRGRSASAASCSAPAPPACWRAWRSWAWCSASAWPRTSAACGCRSRRRAARWRGASCRESTPSTANWSSASAPICWPRCTTRSTGCCSGWVVAAETDAYLKMSRKASGSACGSFSGDFGSRGRRGRRGRARRHAAQRRAAHVLLGRRLQQLLGQQRQPAGGAGQPQRRGHAGDALCVQRSFGSCHGPFSTTNCARFTGLMFSRSSASA